MIVTPPSWDDILNAMMGGLSSITIPQGGAGVTEAQYLYFVDWYFGQFDTPEALQASGVAGRTPCVLVSFAGERIVRTSVGRRKDRAEGTFVAICCNDSRRSRKDRATLHRALQDVRRLLGGHAFGLQMTPLRPVAVVVVKDDDLLTAYGVKFTAEYFVDHSKPLPTTMLEVAEGNITDASDPPVPLEPLQVTLT